MCNFRSPYSGVYFVLKVHSCCRCRVFDLQIRVGGVCRVPGLLIQVSDVWFPDQGSDVKPRVPRLGHTGVPHSLKIAPPPRITIDS